MGYLYHVRQKYDLVIVYLEIQHGLMGCITAKLTKVDDDG